MTECLSTHFASVGSFFTVRPQVLVQVSFMNETLAAVRALVRTLISVHLRVTLKGFTAFEAFPTLDACEGVFLHVCFCVHFEVFGVCALKSALLARAALRLCVTPHVPCETGFKPEAFLAVCACVGCFSGVYPHVVVQVSSVDEALPALMARKRLFPHVSFHVNIEISFVVEGFPALSACKRFLPAVDSSVGCEVAYVLEGFSTIVTCHIALRTSLL